MSELFLSVLNMSITASYVILFVILIRFFLKRAPKIISYLLWAVVAFRLIIPFSFESAFSLLPQNATPIPQISMDEQSQPINSGIEPTNAFVSEALPIATVVESVNPLQQYIQMGAYVWILGMIVLLIYSLVSMHLLKNQLKKAQLIEQNIYEAENLQTPFVIGFIHPRIFLPAGLSSEERSYIVMHEQIHIRRKDHLIKALAFLLLTVHWFNPFVWIAFLLMSMDMEFSCDERVLKTMNTDIKKPYATSLLTLATRRQIFNGSPLAFGEGNVKVRIKNVLNYKKPKFWVILLSICLVLAVGIGLMANPKSPIPPTTEREISTVEELWQARTQYIGDNSAVGKLIALLPVPENVRYDHFKLHTSKQPYEIEIVYSAPPEVLTQYDTVESSRSNFFRKNALILLALVDNASGVRATLTDGNREVGFINGREWANYTVGNDIRNYAENPEKLQELFNIEFEDLIIEKISAYMIEETKKVFSPYYELLDFEISDYQEEVVNGNVEASFLYTVTSKNYDKDPDTVGYIKEAKESGDSNYQQLYDEYLQPREMNFYLKAVINKDGFITLYSRNPAIETEWEEVKMSDYIIGNE